MLTPIPEAREALSRAENYATVLRQSRLNLRTFRGAQAASAQPSIVAAIAAIETAEQEQRLYVEACRADLGRLLVGGGAM